MDFNVNRAVHTHKDVVCLRTKSSNLEQLHEIEKLTMYISTNLVDSVKGQIFHRSNTHGHWTINVLYIALLHQYFLCLCT